MGIGLVQAQQSSPSLSTYLPSDPGSQFPIIEVEKEAKALAHDQKIMDRELATGYYTAALYKVQSLLQSGSIYYGDALTTYLSQMVQKLEEVDPSSQKIRRVLLSNSDVPNAMCVMDGTIIVNLGLFRVIRNEAQLAAILSHEIAHFRKAHALRQNEAERKSAPRSRKAQMYSAMKYSRESEYEADAAGLAMLAASQWDARQYSPALEWIVNAAADSTGPAIWDLFKTDALPIDTNWITAAKIRKELKQSARSNEHFYAEDDALFQSHPGGEKRQLATEEILSSMNYSAPAPVNDSTFQRLHKLALLELARNQFVSANYMQGLYTCMVLESDFPDDPRRRQLLAANLSWLVYLKSQSILDDLLDETALRNNRNLATLKLVLKKSKSDDLGKFLFLYLKKELESHPDDEALMYYLASAAEHHLGREAAKVHYRNYLKKYPQGFYADYVQERVQGA